MFQMEVGQEGYLSAGAVTLIDNNLFIDSNGSISATKNTEKSHIIPIKRIGAGKDDFEIDFNIAFYFYHEKIDQKKEKAIKENEDIIGPYPVKIEVYKQSDYRKQLYPRMDLNELFESLVRINQSLGTSPEEKDCLEDRKALRKYIKAKLEEMSFEVLKTYEQDFSELNEEESEGGTIVNFLADENILKFILDKLKNRKLEDMSVEELQKELEISNEAEDWDRSTEIRDMMVKKNQVV
ncbi:MAG: hypothetical protein ACD_80C00012G0029 [uncultured bacterium (gcode 4)]|uniref:Uncharacterized protein n=1 Tax=uncultured bacterium (gcode 4) TaxID=1234023 RepID=K1XZ75_9BACT|nr:MAG: hypothetical protein ACD_80C00012G0029 [uncultured bacterium (gcode 4)]HBB04855.1 hypothetical protein [Candidatus Gracilibacteria bacterium]